MSTVIILQQRLHEILGKKDDLKFEAVSGGSINDAYRIKYGSDNFFCKINSATKFPHLFKKEKNGLTLIRQQNKLRTPAVIDSFEAGGNQFLLLEWITEGHRTEDFWKLFGRQLAALHQAKSETCGFDEDNYMGSVPQANKRQQSWVTFFKEARLAPLVIKCAANNLLSSNDCSIFERLSQELPSIFEEESPSLLHGDLWSGNFLCNQNAEPVLIDPAVYYGHRSMDLAMTTLFGGFRQQFYEAYQYHYPLPSNYKEQWAVCNLYPLLIHLYLFGTSYLPSIRNTLRQFT